MKYIVKQIKQLLNQECSTLERTSRKNLINGIMDSRFRAMKEQKYGLEFEPWDKETWVDCSSCKRWFKNAELLRMHAAICSEPIV